jgi:AAA+ ATPase superfamily predicted ATPase
MFTYFYRKDDQDIFTGRKHELSLLEGCLLAKRPVDAHLSGLRRIGKTMLIKEFIKRRLRDRAVLPVYINLEEIAETPEDFALKFIGWHLYWHYAKGDRLPGPFLHLPSLLFEVHDKALRDALLPITQELEKAKPDRQRLLQECFGFSESLARFTKRRVLLFLDEFQEIQNLTNFDQTKNILKIMRGVKDRSANVTYCISGSIISEMEWITKDDRSPFFNQFSHINIPSYSPAESRELIRKFIPDIDARNAGLLHHYSGGNPFYLVQLLRKAVLFLGRGEEVSESLIKRAFISETLSPNGLIHSYCNYLYSVSLQRAKGYGVLKSLLDAIAASESPMTQSELARDLRMTQGAVRVNLKELQAIGLLMERDRRYYYNDPVLRYWVAYVQNGIEAPDFPKEKDLVALIEELDRKYRLVSEELGREKEGTIRGLMRLFAGQRVEGRLFGSTRAVMLPRFKSIERFISDDGRTELDVLARNGVRWAVEVKWKSKAAGEKEVSAFFQKAAALADRCWYVSKAGFTREATVFASKKEMFLSSEREIGILKRELEKT